MIDGCKAESVSLVRIEAPRGTRRDTHRVARVTRQGRQRSGFPVLQIHRRRGSRIQSGVGFAVACLVALVAMSRPPIAQTSASYDVSDYVLNEGGHPGDGIVLSSASYRISLDSVGDGLAAPALSSLSYRMAAGFLPAFPPPAEVLGVTFLANHATMQWLPDRSIGSYNVYRGAINQLPGPYGSCRASNVLTESTNLTETPAPPGGGFFYLVTAKNSLGEEGTKGFASSGSERVNPSPCP